MQKKFKFPPTNALQSKGKLSCESLEHSHLVSVELPD